MKRVFGQLFEHRGQIARIGNQDGFSAHAQPQHHVHREGEDVVQRQSTHRGGLLTRRNALHDGLIPGLRLQNVGDHVAVQQHSTFGHAGGATGVLQHRDVVGGELGFSKSQLPTFAQGIVELDRLGQVENRHHLFDISHHVIDQTAFEPTQTVAHRSRHHMLHRCLCDAFFKRRCKVFDDHDRFGARVLELVLQLPRGVQRVHVDHHKTGSQDGRHGHRVLRHIGHHDGDAVTLNQSQRLPVRGQRQAFLVGLGKTDVLAHETVSTTVSVFGETVFKQADQGAVGVRRNLSGNAFGVTFQPNGVQHVRVS